MKTTRESIADYVLRFLERVSVVFGHVEFVWFDGSLEDFLACALSGFISFGSG